MVRGAANRADQHGGMKDGDHPLPALAMQEQGDVCEVGGSVVTSTSRTEEFTTAARRDRTGIQTKQRVVNTHMRRQRGAKMCLSLRIGSVRARKPLVCGHLSTTLSGVLAGHQWAQI